ncbi:MAG: type II toxin-antitoxin system prevent-host-death family antitoxin [Sterolibacteriaceae bacterium]|jgi:prevent-host-death family protein|nr:type II toxin-antitoxin system prevent-host-death family antitoxin [Sterolibacteriaceae bacterium]MBK7663950.1 type II toxin-antitoxin system prevent-host-death family antitoxin [Sterolibacteriaceae bacterium]MBK9084283.1 type II toxin-antitoxin system prevent-host-death family antitoxin [Sterolibacteriaceae bacterium]
MKQQVSLREANQHLSRYIEAVERGEEVIITRRGKPVAKIVRVSSGLRLTGAQKLARERMLARMNKGYRLEGRVPARELLHER